MDLDQKLTVAPCPCGCANFLVAPFFHAVESTLDFGTASELARRWNAHGEMLAALKKAKPMIGAAAAATVDNGNRRLRERVYAEVCDAIAHGEGGAP